MPNARLESAIAHAYTIERELGGGGMSEVYVAEERSLGRKVVVKVVPADVGGAVSLERFRREIALAARLQHPHIVPVLSAGDADGLPYYTMPYVEGDSLRARIHRGEFPIAEAVAVLRDVARALAYAHAHGVVHRDIKPDNVLLSGGAAVVTDFGVAKALAAATTSARAADGAGLTSIGVALGTPAYMAPEQAAADPAVDARADVYAWGVLAFELLCGRTPFAGRAPSAMIAAHIAEAPEPVTRLRPSTPPALAALVMRCLAKAPADRPANGQTLVDALDALATPAGTPAFVRRRTSLAVFAVAALAVLAAAAFGLWDRARAPKLDMRRVVVAPLENLTGDPSLDNVGRVAADWFTEGASQIDSLSVVSSSTVRASARDAAGSYGERARRLALGTGAGLLVSGSVVRRGRDSLQVDVRLADASTGRSIATLEAARGPLADPLVAVDAARERLLGALASETSTFRTTLVGRRRPSYAAYAEYVLGSERITRYYDNAGAAEHYQRAIALDSTFAAAHVQLAMTHFNRNQYAAAESVARRAERLRGGLQPGDVPWLDWLQAKVRGDEEAALRAERRSVARDSSPLMLYLMGLTGVRLNRPRIAVPALERADSFMVATGWYWQTRNLANAYHLAGRHDDELATLERGRQLFPNERGIVSQQIAALAALRRGPRAVALADTVLRGTTDPAAATLERVLVGAFEFDAHGDSATAATLVRMALDWYAAHPLAAEPPTRASERGRAFYLLGRLDSAEAYLVRAARDTTALDAAAYLAATRLRRTGDRAAAERTADSLGALRRPYVFGGHTLQRAAIVAQLGDAERATQLVRQAFTEGQFRHLVHYAPLLAPLRRYPPFVALITPER